MGSLLDDPGLVVISFGGLGLVGVLHWNNGGGFPLWRKALSVAEAPAGMRDVEVRPGFLLLCKAFVEPLEGF